MSEFAVSFASALYIPRAFAAVMIHVHGLGLIHDSSVQPFPGTMVVLCWTWEGCRAQTTDVTRLGSVDCTTLAGWSIAQECRRRTGDLHRRATASVIANFFATANHRTGSFGEGSAGQTSTDTSIALTQFALPRRLMVPSVSAQRLIGDAGMTG